MSMISDLSKKLFYEHFSDLRAAPPKTGTRTPIHVVYGGADRYTSDTAKKFGRLALRSIENYAPNFVEFAKAMWLSGADTLPAYPDLILELESRLTWEPDKVKVTNYPAWSAWTIYNRVIQKLAHEPVEDFRIDFEDGYGIRSDEEEDSHCLSASEQLAITLRGTDAETVYCGFRIKSFHRATYDRSVRTLDLFISNLIKTTGQALPRNFVVTLPKITRAAEVTILAELLDRIESQNGQPADSIKIEIMIETPESILILRELVESARGRCVAAHFGAYDYTACFGITAVHQHLKHDACNYARQMMQIHPSPLGVRLSDSVTTELPVAVHRGDLLIPAQINENRRAVHKAWRLHFNNVTNSMINGFYQSWDLHPAQLPARYAAVYSFFLESCEDQGRRLKSFISEATKAAVVKNQFDDAASAQGLLNFFIRGFGCGAFTEPEVLEATGLNMEELISGSFAEILNHRGIN